LPVDIPRTASALSLIAQRLPKLSGYLTKYKCPSLYSSCLYSPLHRPEFQIFIPGTWWHVHQARRIAYIRDPSNVVSLFVLPENEDKTSPKNVITFRIVCFKSSNGYSAII
jgi:hypothetical protein